MSYLSAFNKACLQLARVGVVLSILRSCNSWQRPGEHRAPQDGEVCPCGFRMQECTKQASKHHSRCGIHCTRSLHSAASRLRHR